MPRGIFSEFYGNDDNNNKLMIISVKTTTTTTEIISFWLFQIRVWNSDAFIDSSHNHARGIYSALAQDAELNLLSNIFS